ncbi:MAG: beta-class carbonic anhydrase [Candidatus Nanopelagicales bacterium]
MTYLAQEHGFPDDVFADVVAANATYARNFKDAHLTGKAVQGLAIITCMDSRIEPLAIVGMRPGDVKIIRNAGARVTEDVLRTLVLATHLLGVRRILVMPHTDCRMASGTEAEVHAQILAASGMDTRSLEIRTERDQEQALRSDLTRIRAFPLLHPQVDVAGAIYNVSSGLLQPFRG